MSSWQDLIAAGRLILVGKAPYFRAILYGLVVTECVGLGTIAVTDTALLLVDPAFIVQVGAPEAVAGLLCHEIMHVINGHTKAWRNTGRDQRYMGLAQDLAINPAVLEMSFELPKGDLGPCLPDSKEFPKSAGFERGLTADEYYEILVKTAPQPPPSSGGKNGKGPSMGRGKGGAGGEGEPDEPNDESGEGGEGGDADHDHEGEGDPTDKRLPSKPSAGQGWCGSCSARPAPNEPKGKEAEAQGARAAGEVKRLVRAVAEAVNEEVARNQGRGNVPAGLRRWADDMCRPPEIAWNVKLRRIGLAAAAWVQGAVTHRYDGPSRRQAGLGYGPGSPVLPRLRAPKPIIDVIADTSGSMTAHDLGTVAAETLGMVKQCNAEIRLSACDAGTHGNIAKIKTVEDMVNALRGGGGTDMRPAFDQLMAQKPTPRVIVCITDGMVGDGFPSTPPPNVRVIICLVGKSQVPIPNTAWAETISVPAGAALGTFDDDDY